MQERRARQILQALIQGVDPFDGSELASGTVLQQADVLRALLAELPPSVDPCGERGEFHTFAHAGPMFRHPVPFRAGEVVARDGFVFADLLP